MGEVGDHGQASGENDDAPAFSAENIAEFERLAIEHRERTRRLCGRWALLSWNLERKVFWWRNDLARRWHRARGRYPWLMLRKWWWRSWWRGGLRTGG